MTGLSIGQLFRFAYRDTGFWRCSLPLAADAHVVVTRTAYTRLKGAAASPYPDDAQQSTATLRASIAGWLRRDAGMDAATVSIWTETELLTRMAAIERGVRSLDEAAWRASQRVRAQAVLGNAGAAVVRWVSNGRMLYLRHAAFRSATRAEAADPALRYSYFLSLREDNSFLTAAVLPRGVTLSSLRALRPGFVASDVHCAFGGAPSDKIFLADPLGADRLFGNSSGAHIRMLVSWLRFGVRRAAALPAAEERRGGTPPKPRSADPLHSESFLAHHLADHGLLRLRWRFLRTDLRFEVRPGSDTPTACVRMMYYKCGPSIMRDGKLRQPCPPSTARDRVAAAALTPRGGRWSSGRGWKGRGWNGWGASGRRGTSGRGASGIGRNWSQHRGASGDLLAGDVVLQSSLGRGTYGIAVRARSSSVGSLALKVPRAPYGETYQDGELRALQHLHSGSQHPHVVRLHGVLHLPANAFDGLLTQRTRSTLRCQDGTFVNMSELVRTAPRHRGNSPGAVRALALEVLSRDSFSAVLRRIGNRHIPRKFPFVGGDPARAGPRERPVLSGQPVSLPPISVQEASFRRQLLTQRDATNVLGILTRPRRGNVELLDALVGVASAMAHLERRHVIHRDLVWPGKNILFRRLARPGAASIGPDGGPAARATTPAGAGGELAAVMIDFSSAKVCPPHASAHVFAIEAYTFGSLLAFVCYGHDHRPNNTRMKDLRCAHTAAARQAMQNEVDAVAVEHRRIHPGGRAALLPGVLNRCNEPFQGPMDALMRYCWRGVTELADSRRSTTDCSGQGNESAQATMPWRPRLQGSCQTSSRARHGREFRWSAVIEQLVAMRNFSLAHHQLLFLHRMIGAPAAFMVPP